MQDKDKPVFQNDTALRVEALSQARHACAGRTTKDLIETAEAMYRFLKGD